MVKFLQLFLVTVFVIIIEIFCSKPIGNILSEYYESDLVKTFKQEWEKYKKPYEHAIMTSLKESYGRMGMNVYVRHVLNSRRITRGFYLSDNVVNVLFYDMILRECPNLIMPEVSLSLPSNLLKVEATVSKMFVDTNYRMSRNESAVLYSVAELDQNKHSPFSLQHVQPTGKLTISAEDCFLSGFAVVTLSGNSVGLGHSTFRLEDCKFTVEISSDFGSPPVIAPYFPKGPGRQIERLLSAPILDEAVQYLQGAMYSYINTSVTFGTELHKYKNNQLKLFKKTSNYLSKLCEKLNDLTLKERRGSIPLRDFDERIESKTDEVRSTTYLALKELKLYGLDTAYASRTGGSYEAPQLSIADAIRFHTMQIRGKDFYDNGTQSNTHEFAAELTDVSVNIIVNVDKEGSNSVHKFDVLFARTFDFSVLPWETVLRDRLWYQALVSGYIINEVPARITEHLSKVLTPAVNTEEDEELKVNRGSDEQVDESETENNNKNQVEVHSNYNTADVPAITKEASVSVSIEHNRDENTDDVQLSDNQEHVINADDNASVEQLDETVIKPQENDIGTVVKAPSAKDDNHFDTDEAPLPDPADNLNKESPDDDRPTHLGDKTDIGLDKDFFSDGEGKKPFFSDDGSKNVEGKKPFFSDDGGDRFFSDGIEKKKNIENHSGLVANSDKDNDNNNNGMTGNEPKGNGQEKQILIFASYENEKDQIKADISKQSAGRTVPIGRTGNNGHRIRHSINNKRVEVVNQKKPIVKKVNLDKKDTNNLKLTLRKNPRANITHARLLKKTTDRVNRVQTSQVHKNTRLNKHEMHMSDNEIH